MTRPQITVDKLPSNRIGVTNQGATPYRSVEHISSSNESITRDNYRFLHSLDSVSNWMPFVVTAG